MDDIVAVEVRLADGASRYFLTWGRIQDAVDPVPLARLVLDQCDRFDLGGEPVSARVRWNLSDAAAEPYFSESFFAMCQRPIPFGDDFPAWRLAMDEKMHAGKELYYLGRARADEPDEPHATRG